MSKNFWKHRPTTTVAPVPKDDSETDESSSEGEEIQTDYDQLLNAFVAKKSQVGSEDENSEQEDDLDGEGEEDDVDDDDELLDEEDDIGNSNEEDSEDETNGQDADENGASGSDNTDPENSDAVGSDDQDEEDPDANDLEESSDDDGLEQEENDGGKIMPDLTGGPKDPFTARYELKIPETLLEIVKNRQFKSEPLKWRKLGRMVYLKPEWKPESQGSKAKLSLIEDDDGEGHPEVRAGQMELISKPVNVLAPVGGLETNFVKLQLARNASLVNIKHLYDDSQYSLNPFQQELFSIFNSYRDFCYNERTLSNGEEIRFVYTLHALNHLLKTRTKIVNNNARLTQQQKEGKKKKKDGEEPNVNYRDQGLVRPKVLIVVPFKESCRKIVELMTKLLFSKDSNRGTVMKKKKFDEEFGTEEDAVVGFGTKPDDYYETFIGNIDDGFKLGIGVTKKALKLYTDFYSSDILIASPLGLRMVLENDSDFLSSVELLIMDQVDMFMMQNWEHVTFIMEHLHQRPTKSHGVDFSRVRLWNLDELSRFYRQSLFFTSTPMVELNAVFNRSCHNYLGRLSTVNPVKTGSISGVVLTNIPIVFHRVDSTSLASSIDDRFNYFVQKIMPEYKKDMMFHTLIFVPSYFDYVRLRNWFNKSDLDCGEICEYTKDHRIAQVRDQFFHGDKHFVLYTERTHFYKRLTIKGIRHLIFYQLPQNWAFFSEICNLMQPSFLNRKGGSDGNMTCTTLYTKYDNLRLSSVCSTSKAEFMTNAQKNVHLFMAGGS